MNFHRLFNVLTTMRGGVWPLRPSTEKVLEHGAETFGKVASATKEVFQIPVWKPREARSR
jgi:hypothetical protein